MEASFDETSKHNQTLPQSACDKDYEIMKSYDQDLVFFILVKKYEIISIVSVLGVNCMSLTKIKASNCPSCLHILQPLLR